MATKVENINDCSWLYDYLGIHVEDGQEVTTDTEDAILNLTFDITYFDEDDVCWYYRDMTDEEMAEAVGRYHDMIWDGDGDVRLRRWRVQATDHVDNMGCTNWLEYDHLVEAETAYDRLVEGVEVIRGDGFELVEVDWEGKAQNVRTIAHS